MEESWDVMRGSCGQLDQASQDFGDAPGLRDAAAGCVWLRRIEYLADAADARVAQVRVERVQKRARFLVAARMDAQPRVDEGTDEPRPYGPLVICGVSRPQIAEVLSLEVGILLVERSKAVRREQTLGHHVQDAGPPRFVEDGMAERERENLIGPARGIVSS